MDKIMDKYFYVPFLLLLTCVFGYQLVNERISHIDTKTKVNELVLQKQDVAYWQTRHQLLAEEHNKAKETILNSEKEFGRYKEEMKKVGDTWSKMFKDSSERSLEWQKKYREEKTLRENLEKQVK